MAEVASHRYSDRKDELAAIEQETIQRRHDEDMARVQHNTAQAIERAAKLEKETAEAQKETAKARLEQERLKAQLAWRTIPPEASTELERVLSQHPSKINIQWVAADTEAQFLAIQIANILDRAHWELRTLAISLTGAISFGVRVPDSPSPDTEIVRNAFRSVGIPFSIEMPPLQNQTMAFGGTIKDAPIVFIGSKPIPQ